MKNQSIRVSDRPRIATAAFLLALLVGGCATVQDWTESIRGAVGADASGETTASADGARDDAADEPARRALARGIERYEAGDFAQAVRLLDAAEIAQADPAVRVEAGKYLAFSYCVTNRRTLCRRAFDRVLAIDPRFELQPAEAGHPLWGPVYVQARRAAAKRAN